MEEYVALKKLSSSQDLETKVRLVHMSFERYQNICPNLVMVGNGPYQDFLRTYNIMSLHPMKLVMNILEGKMLCLLLHVIHHLHLEAGQHIIDW